MFLPIHLLTAINSHKCNHKVYVLPIQIISFPNQISHFHEFSPERSRFPSLFPAKSVKSRWRHRCGGEDGAAPSRAGTLRLRTTKTGAMKNYTIDWLWLVNVGKGYIMKIHTSGMICIFRDYRWLYHIVPYFTSSTAQGGGGSFKHRKPIGEVGCCESRMAERIHWWTERWLELCFLEWLQWLQWSPHHNCWM